MEKTITLPVCGKEAVIRPMDGYAENILFCDGKFFRVFPRFWASLTIRLGDKTPATTDDILDLVLPDQHFLAIEIYRLTFGDELVLSSTCANCGKPYNLAVDLGALDLVPLPAGSDPTDPVFEMIMPVSKDRVKFGYVTGRMEMKELELEGFDPVRMEFNAIRSINGSTDFKLRDVMAKHLADHKALRKAILDKQCGYDTRIRLKHGCGREAVINLLIDPSFLTPGLAV